MQEIIRAKNGLEMDICNEGGDEEGGCDEEEGVVRRNGVVIRRGRCDEDRGG